MSLVLIRAAEDTLPEESNLLYGVDEHPCVCLESQQYFALKRRMLSDSIAMALEPYPPPPPPPPPPTPPPSPYDVDVVGTKKGRPKKKKSRKRRAKTIRTYLGRRRAAGPKARIGKEGEEEAAEDETSKDQEDAGEDARLGDDGRSHLATPTGMPTDNTSKRACRHGLELPPLQILISVIVLPAARVYSEGPVLGKSEEQRDTTCLKIYVSERNVKPQPC